VGERKIILTTLIFHPKLLTKILDRGLRQIHVMKIEYSSWYSYLKDMEKIQTALTKSDIFSGAKRYPVIVYNSRLKHECERCEKSLKTLYYYEGDKSSDRKYEDGMICVDCYVRQGDNIVLKMRIEKLDWKFQY